MRKLGRIKAEATIEKIERIDLKRVPFYYISTGYIYSFTVLTAGLECSWLLKNGSHGRKARVQMVSGGGGGGVGYAIVHLSTRRSVVRTCLVNFTLLNSSQHRWPGIFPLIFHVHVGFSFM